MVLIHEHIVGVQLIVSFDEGEEEAANLANRGGLGGDDEDDLSDSELEEEKDF